MIYRQRALAGGEDGQTRGCAEALLTAGENDVDAPFIHSQFLACDGAYGIYGDLTHGHVSIHRTQRKGRNGYIPAFEAKRDARWL
jgi:hypothetical protein